MPAISASFFWLPHFLLARRRTASFWRKLPGGFGFQSEGLQVMSCLASRSVTAKVSCRYLEHKAVVDRVLVEAHVFVA
jgi:hypothetical protein